MTTNPSHVSQPEESMNEFIEKYPNELKDDGVGFDEIVFYGRHAFKLEGAALDDFAHRAVASVWRAGGRPKRSVDRRWTTLTTYGADAQSVACAIVAEWIALGRPDIEFYHGIRFRLDESFYWPS